MMSSERGSDKLILNGPHEGRGPNLITSLGVADGVKATPMIAQYLSIKSEHPHALLLYRMGDFFEFFFEDAVKVAKVLDITLTKRGRHEGEDIPMCGVPAHSVEGYLERLIRKGFKVAVCDQIEDPAAAKKRGNKAVVRREVTRIVTPGTLTEDSLLNAGSHNFLLALARVQDQYALAWLDLSTGDVQVAPVELDALSAELSRIAPKEILISENFLQSIESSGILNDWKAFLTPIAVNQFESASAERRLRAFYGVVSLEGYGTFGRADVSALGALVSYVETTQKGQLPSLKPPVWIDSGTLLEIDSATRRNLELVQSLAGERVGSLLKVIDKTVTSAGARLLRAHLSAPLTDVNLINQRLDRVQAFTDEELARVETRKILRRCPDIERAFARLTLGRGGPRDLAAIRDGLAESEILPLPLSEKMSPVASSALENLLQNLGSHEVLIELLNHALGEELPLSARDGGFVAKGYNSDLDELKVLRDESRSLITGLEIRYSKDVGIQSLKIRHNKVLGYFVEVTATHADKIGIQNEIFIHRQTMANAVRYTTIELSTLETRILSAAEKELSLEIKLFEELVKKVTEEADEILKTASVLASFDVASSLAELAAQCRYVRPLIDDSNAFCITAGRHAVVEAALGEHGEATFVANDCNLSSPERLWLLSGPNMAGKSTFLRQNAIIAILAQMGSFVPAEAAHIGVIDRLFSRVGAADDLARGRSTFMVEMVETATILNRATPKSLVILDEIGRGTATFDGLSLAWATVEHLEDVNECRGLFATHYHELTNLAPRLAALACYTIRVKEWQGSVVFLHTVVPGVADRSYGVQVAKLAGLPGSVITRAEQILLSLEKGQHAGTLSKLADDLPLFTNSKSLPEYSQPSELTRILSEINADELSPREALELLYRLKVLVADAH